MEAITGYTRFLRRTMQHETMPGEMYEKLEKAHQQLLTHQPVQYILGFAHFYGMKFFVNESVLIPRPETEELVEWMVGDEKKNNRHLQIIDIGTGSGCIAVTLKKKLAIATVHGIDLSAAALQVAAINASYNQAEVQFSQLDFLDETTWHQLPQYDRIVSNPPYIPKFQKTAMDKNVTAWEPDMALFVPDEEPLLFYKKIAAFGKKYLATGGVIYMETHQDYAGAVQALFAATGYTAVIKKDINGNERMMKGVNRES